MNVVFFLIGNGLSVAIRPDLALAELSASFLHELQPADRTVLEELTKGPIEENLEGALSNIETLRDALHTIHKIREQIASPDLGAIAHTIAETDLVARLEHLYYSYCTLVLARLAEAWNLEEVGARLEHWLEFADAWIDEADGAHFFTLNFDLLLEHALLNPALLNLADRTTDFFLPADPPPRMARRLSVLQVSSRDCRRPDPRVGDPGARAISLEPRHRARDRGWLPLPHVNAVLARRPLSKPSRWRFLVKNSETEISRWRAPIAAADTAAFGSAVAVLASTVDISFFDTRPVLAGALLK